jgi:hypothetical protein
LPSRKNVANFSHIAASVHSVQYNEFSGAEGDSRNRWWEIGMDDRTARAALMYHWDASDAGDLELEHETARMLCLIIRIQESGSGTTFK